MLLCPLQYVNQDFIEFLLFSCLKLVFIMFCSGANARVSHMKNPPKCVGGNLRIISYQYFSQSTVSAPTQYISQFYTAVYYLPGLLQF